MGHWTGLRLCQAQARSGPCRDQCLASKGIWWSLASTRTRHITIPRQRKHLHIVPPTEESLLSFAVMSHKEEGSAVPPQAKGSWSSFLKVKKSWIRACSSEETANMPPVDSILQWRPLFSNCAAFHSVYDVADRILHVLGGAPDDLRGASL